MNYYSTMEISLCLGGRTPYCKWCYEKSGGWRSQEPRLPHFNFLTELGEAVEVVVSNINCEDPGFTFQDACCLLCHYFSDIIANWSGICFPHSKCCQSLNIVLCIVPRFLLGFVAFWIIVGEEPAWGKEFVSIQVNQLFFCPALALKCVLFLCTDSSRYLCWSIYDHWWTSLHATGLL